MKYFVLIVFLFVGVICGAPQKKEKDSFDDAVKSLSNEAQQELRNIVRTDKPFNAMTNELREFAAKYNIKDQMNEMIDLFTYSREDARVMKKVSAVISSMSEKHKKLVGVFQNEKSSLRQRVKARQDFQAESTEATSILYYLYRVYSGGIPEGTIRKINGEIARARRHTGNHIE